MIKPWDVFFEEKIKKIFSEKQTIIDIGGGLRVDPARNNRLDKQHAWLQPYIEKVNYKILDKVADYNPDIVGDIHHLPFADNSIDAIVCIAVLEHVEEPQQAMREVYRALKPGGYCYVYVPFLFYYHPLSGYYKDYFRFTYDGVQYLMKDFSHLEIQNVRGAVATVANLLPFLSKRTNWLDWMDRISGKIDSKQTSGYSFFGVK